MVYFFFRSSVYDVFNVLELINYVKFIDVLIRQLGFLIILLCLSHIHSRKVLSLDLLEFHFGGESPDLLAETVSGLFQFFNVAHEGLLTLLGLLSLGLEISHLTLDLRESLLALVPHLCHLLLVGLLVLLFRPFLLGQIVHQLFLAEAALVALLLELQQLALVTLHQGEVLLLVRVNVVLVLLVLHLGSFQ